MRQDISRLRRNRGIHFQIGLSISLLVSIMTLNITVYPDEVDETQYEMPVNDFDFEMVRTAHPKPISPPPPKPNLENIIEVDHLPEIAEPKLTLDEPIIEVPVDTKVKFKAPPTPVAPPPPPPLPTTLPDIPFRIVEEMPVFGDCDDLNKSERRSCSDKNILAYIHNRLKYPALARENGVEGTVVVSFIINKKGQFSKPEIARDIGAGCGEEVLRVLKDMPDWIPGRQQGRKVSVQFNVPVKFQLH